MFVKLTSRGLLNSTRGQTVRMASTAAQKPTIDFNIAPDNIFIGSCIRVPDDAKAAKEAGVKTIISLQDDTDLQNQKLDNVDVSSLLAVQGINHIRCPTSDADKADFLGKLPGAVATLAKERSQVDPSNGVYIHCNGGRGRAPTVVAAYYFWLAGLGLKQAVERVKEARPSSPKVDVIIDATNGILQDLSLSGEDADLTAEQRTAIASYLKTLM